MDNQAAAKKIQEIVEELFEQDKIDLVIGHEAGTVALKSRPYFIRKDDEDRTEEIKKLTWNSFCSNNIAVFLPKFYEIDPFRKKKDETPKPRIAVTVKGCDMRSIVALVKEKQVPRDHLQIIGVPCQGMIDKRKVEERLGGEEIVEASEEGDTLTVKTKSGKTESVPREEVLRPACSECRFPMPEGVDHLLEGEAREPGDGGYVRIEEFEKQSVDERWEYIKTEIGKCIRCYACRQACPTCYCKECFAEQIDMKWIGATNDFSDNMLFHIIRVFHQAGRCVECDACYDACPQHIDLRTLTKKMAMDTEKLYGYVPDFEVETVPPLSTFKEEDPEQFITDPDKK